MVLNPNPPSGAVAGLPSGSGASPEPAASPSPTRTATPSPSPVTIDDDDTPLGFIADHIQYINGYLDGSVRPDADITRAETAAILFRLLEFEAKHDTYTSKFPDVTDDAWYAQSVKYLTHIEIIKGYPDGLFRPDNPITRAEFATLISGFDKLAPSSRNNFSDIDGHWAVGYINSAATKGWVAGYPDGSFRPEANLTRAEIVTVINRMLKRGIELEDLPDWAPSYNDIDETHWGYLAIMEASIGHEFNRKNPEASINTPEGIIELRTRRLNWSSVLES